MQDQQFQSFLELHQLPSDYLDQAFSTYQSLINDLLTLSLSKQPIVLGINGCQGSGKSTTAAFLQQVFEEIHKLKVVNISLDDFYLSKAARVEKSKTLHPLFATRGVPGTHDTELALKTIQQLLVGDAPPIPRFNKATDDVLAKHEWKKAPKNVDLIILEGWFLCAQPQEESALAQAVNELERDEDSKGIWRKHVNEQLKHPYQKLFNLVDRLVMLKAPSFDTVFNWRLEQEKKLAKKLLLSNTTNPNKAETSAIQKASSGIMTDDQIKRFVQYFQRLTEHMLTEMPERADHCYFLDTERQIVHERHKDSHN